MTVKPSDNLELQTEDQIYEAMKADAQDATSTAYLGEYISNWLAERVIPGLVRLWAKGQRIFYVLLAYAFDQVFPQSCADAMLDIHGAQAECVRKQLIFAAYDVTFYRNVDTNPTGDIAIAAGKRVGTTLGADDTQLIFTSAAGTLPHGFDEVKIACTAFEGGADSNVGAGAINTLIDAIAGIASVSNVKEADQLTAGQDLEAMEPYRARVLLVWPALAIGSTADKLLAAALAVDGVEDAAVDDHEPRGEGTADINIKPGDNPTLIDLVQAAIDLVTGLTEDTLVAGATAVEVDTYIAVVLEEGYSWAQVEAPLEAAIEAMYADTLGIGDDVTGAKLVKAIMAVSGIADVASYYFVSGVARMSVPIAADEYSTSGTITSGEYVEGA
jgi:uncharacterized phage protein gp47/JayE